MLATQVSYWQNVEAKRHNLAMESLSESEQQISRDRLGIDSLNAQTNRLNAITNQRNAEVNERNADTNAANASVNSVNALTNQDQFRLAQQRLELDRDIQGRQLEIGFGNLDLNQLIAKQNYDLGLRNNQVAQTQARASTMQASASQAQAAAAQSQARSAAITAQANADYTRAKTDYQNLDNSWYMVNNGAALAGNAISKIPIVGEAIDKYLPKGSKTNSDLPNSQWDKIMKGRK